MPFNFYDFFPYNMQMIMGAGKTTVVGPLLAMLLADSKTLIVEVSFLYCMAYYHILATL